MRRGQVFMLDGRKFKVAYVNASRAHCVAQERVPVTIKGRTFTRTRSVTLDISPNTCVEVLVEVSRGAL